MEVKEFDGIILFLYLPHLFNNDVISECSLTWRCCTFSAPFNVPDLITRRKTSSIKHLKLNFRL